MIKARGGRQDLGEDRDSKNREKVRGGGPSLVNTEGPGAQEEGVKGDYGF